MYIDKNHVMQIRDADIYIIYMYIDKNHVMQIRVAVPFLSNMAESGVHTESSKINCT